MRIALVILHADTARGGAERYTLDLAAALVKRGHDVSILASSFQSQPFAGMPILIEARGITRTGRYVSFIDQVESALTARGNEFDVVHAMLPVRSCDIYHPHAGIAVEAVEAGHLNKAGKVSRFLSQLGNRFNSRRNKFAEVERTLLSENPPVVFCLSNLIKAVVKNHYPQVPEQKLIPLFNGIDLQRFDPEKNRPAWKAIRDRFNLAEDAIVGLMLAQDFERKGLRQAIEALARVKDPRMILLVGGKPDPTGYQKFATTLGVFNRVIFAGAVSQPVDFYQASDFFVLPTFFDPCSLVVLESLAMGVPVISTTKNGACEIMTDRVHGRVLADSNDIGVLEDAMIEMIDSRHRKILSAACLELRPILSQVAHVDRVEAVYAAVTKSGGRRITGGIIDSHLPPPPIK